MGERKVLTGEERILAAQGRLHFLVIEAISRWEKSDGEIIDLGANSALDSMPKMVAAKALRCGIEKGEILIGLTRDFSAPMYKVAAFRPKGADQNQAMALAVFRPNFEELAEQNIDRIIESCLEDLIKLDATLRSNPEKSQAIVPVSNSRSLVRIMG